MEGVIEGFFGAMLMIYENESNQRLQYSRWAKTEPENLVVPNFNFAQLFQFFSDFCIGSMR
jgi:hypothetical protein